MKGSMRALVLSLLLMAILAWPALGCSGGAAMEKGVASQPTQTVAQTTPEAPAAMATPAAVASPVAAASSTRPPASVAAPTATPTVPPTLGAAQTIRQDIVMHNSGGEGGVTVEGTFTMTAEIQVGVVDGINYTSQAVPMPKGAVPYQPGALPAVGKAVQGDDGLVLQVTGWRTVDVDAESQFVLVDVIVGNAGKERQLVATNPCMEIVTGDGHWYSPTWYALYWMGTQGEENAAAMAQGLHDKLLQKGITSDFSAAIEPGQAAKGTAAFPVPKSARQLAFGFQSYLAATYLFFANEASPTTFVPLGAQGDFPVVPGDVKALQAGTTYRVGQSFRSPKRGVALQVQSVWKRQQSLGDMWPLGPGEQFVVVNLLAPAGDGATPLDQTRELALVDGSGRAFEVQEYASDWLTLRLGRFNQRGVVVFKGPRAATGLKLKFTPLDPATMAGPSPKPLVGEAATIDLGEIPVAPAVPMATPAAQPTAARQPTPTAHRLGDRVVAGDLAITLTGYEMGGGTEDMPAPEGKSWVLAYVSLENVANTDAYVDPEAFDFVDRAGVVHNELWNGPSVSDKISAKVLDYVQMAPGAVLEDRILVIQIEDQAAPGLKLRYTPKDGEAVLWELGI